jgi:hypothetical protein
VIAFLTLFLGLVYGPTTVELSAAAEVARIELFVDGRKAAELGPPWAVSVDLGPEIAPHELVAVARSRDGVRLGEVRQWINRARQIAEAGFVLERDQIGRVTAARLVWRCLSSPNPRSVDVFFDGRRIEAKDPSRIPIPPHLPEVSHILTADLAFQGGVSATAVASFGGRRRDETQRELTAFPVRVTGSEDLPKPDGLAGWFEFDGRPLKVAAVENGPAEVLFVLAGRARQDLERLQFADAWPWPWARRRPLDVPKETRYRFVATEPRLVEGAGQTARLFSTSKDYTPEDGAFLYVAAHSRIDPTPGYPCIAESVAVSALAATARERRRATVLLLGEGAFDRGRLDAARVRRYLGHLRVPLHVWRITSGDVPAASDWPEAVDASTIEALGEAFQSLHADLSSQRLVWVEGRILPSSISVTPKAAGLMEAR